jgi:transposase-like protein
MDYFMINTCASCGKKLGVTPTVVKENHLKISHGTCADCIETLYMENFSPDEIRQLVKKARAREKLMN